VGDDLSGDGVERGDFVGGEQVDHVAADGGDMRRRGRAEDGPPLLGQADERSAGVVGAWLPCYQASLLHPPDVVCQPAGRPEQPGSQVSGPPTALGFLRQS
jgi:hypothetical protein